MEIKPVHGRQNYGCFMAAKCKHLVQKQLTVECQALKTKVRGKYLLMNSSSGWLYIRGLDESLICILPFITYSFTVFPAQRAFRCSLGLCRRFCATHSRFIGELVYTLIDCFLYNQLPPFTKLTVAVSHHSA